MTDKERFWSKVDLSGECWVWTGTKAGGYGRFYLNRRMMPAHRYSWTETSGPIPDGLMVLHKCDNPSCVRPDHLFLGTQSDNMLDASAKNRIHRATRTVTHCLRGHELVGDNMRIRPDGAKVCRVCEVERRGTGRFGERPSQRRGPMRPIVEVVERTGSKKKRDLSRLACGHLARTTPGLSRARCVECGEAVVRARMEAGR